MIIDEVKGNAVSMFLRGEGHFVHGCNCFNNMGAGIAKEVKFRIPELYKADQTTIKGDAHKLGYFTSWEAPNDAIAFNAYTQFKFWGEGPQVDYDAIYDVFRKIAVHCVIHAKHQGLPIITPLIGAGLAGGDWEKIRAIINEVTGKYPVIVVHFDPKAE